MSGGQHGKVREEARRERSLIVPKTPATIGRPSDYTPEVAAELCARMTEGRSLRAVCSDKDMPSTSAVFRWLGAEANDAFREQYARAFEARADAMFEEMLEIADDATNDWMARNDPNNPGWLANGEATRRSQLRIDARKWALARMKPDRYGDKLKLDATVDVRALDTTALIAETLSIVGMLKGDGE